MWPPQRETIPKSIANILLAIKFFLFVMREEKMNENWGDWQTNQNKTSKRFTIKKETARGDK